MNEAEKEEEDYFIIIEFDLNKQCQWKHSPELASSISSARPHISLAWNKCFIDFPFLFFSSLLPREFVQACYLFLRISFQILACQSICLTDVCVCVWWRNPEEEEEKGTFA